jgi:hypothetical protein
MDSRGVELHAPPRGRSAVGRVGTCETLDQSEEVGMESSTPRRILMVAYRTAGTPGLLDEVRRRAAQRRCRFVLLVPRPYWDPETEEAALTLELAIPLLEEAAGGHVGGLIGDSDPLVAVRETLERAVRRGDRLDAAGAGVAMAASRPAIARGATRHPSDGRNGQDVEPPPAGQALSLRVRAVLRPPPRPHRSVGDARRPLGAQATPEVLAPNYPAWQEPRLRAGESARADQCALCPMSSCPASTRSGYSISKGNPYPVLRLALVVKGGSAWAPGRLRLALLGSR